MFSRKDEKKYAKTLTIQEKLFGFELTFTMSGDRRYLFLPAVSDAVPDRTHQL